MSNLPATCKSPAFLVEMQLDSAYFDLGCIALQSFKHHNPKYTLNVRDFGLTPAEVSYLSAFANVIPTVPLNLPDRFRYIAARIDSMLQQPEDEGLTLFLDADTLTLSHISGWEHAMTGDGYDLSMVQEESRFALYKQVTPPAARLLPKLYQ